MGLKDTGTFKFTFALHPFSIVLPAPANAGVTCAEVPKAGLHPLIIDQYCSSEETDASALICRSGPNMKISKNKATVRIPGLILTQRTTS